VRDEDCEAAESQSKREFLK